MASAWNCENRNKIWFPLTPQVHLNFISEIRYLFTSFLCLPPFFLIQWIKCSWSQKSMSRNVGPEPMDIRLCSHHPLIIGLAFRITDLIDDRRRMDLKESLIFIIPLVEGLIIRTSSLPVVPISLGILRRLKPRKSMPFLIFVIWVLASLSSSPLLRMKSLTKRLHSSKIFSLCPAMIKSSAERITCTVVEHPTLSRIVFRLHSFRT